MCVICVEITKNGVNMFRKLVIVLLAVIALPTFMALFMATVKFLLGK
jgi:hypothetical protein